MGDDTLICGLQPVVCLAGWSETLKEGDWKIGDKEVWGRGMYVNLSKGSQPPGGGLITLDSFLMEGTEFEQAMAGEVPGLVLVAAGQGQATGHLVSEAGRPGAGVSLLVSRSRVSRVGACPLVGEAGSLG